MLHDLLHTRDRISASSRHGLLISCIRLKLQFSNRIEHQHATCRNALTKLHRTHNTILSNNHYLTSHTHNNHGCINHLVTHGNLLPTHRYALIQA